MGGGKSRCVAFVLPSLHRTVKVERHLQTAQHLGHVRQTKYFLAILAVIDGQNIAQGALVLRVHEKTVMTWLREFAAMGSGAPRQPTAVRPN